jgi:pimeloyl-ACP methyl ester carboxylesterase
VFKKLEDHMDALTTSSNDLLQLGNKIGQLYVRRALAAQSSFVSSVQTAVRNFSAGADSKTGDLWQVWSNYATDWWQRWVLFSDALRQRGNNFLAHEKAGKPPLLAFDYEVIVDGRTLARPVNYALVRILPPSGVKIDEKKRPFIIIDPRAGHGPGIGGFKQDSQVGVALRAGHAVYFVIFFSRPEPGQTLPDVCEAEGQFVQHVVDRHPESPRPTIIGNCQGGWATMLLAASRPDITGPVVINGAPMSYWSGSWQGGEGENPMRYIGGLLGGSWLSLLTSDLGNGVFDGAHLVLNFENLNPANTLWTKYYHLFANVDTEPPRFLEFEKWWGGYSLMNEAEIRWIVDNLFVGNRLARGEVRAAQQSYIDLKAVRSPIIVFSSSGDNITPPQQALNWIADAYSSTEEIKANGQVIVGLLHPDVGHLGIFVSGRVAKKEHAQIVEVLKYIESLRPGLYLMEIEETKGSNGKCRYEVAIEERRLEDLRRINKLERRDEKAFEVVAEVSALGEKVYSLFVRPFIRPLVNEQMAEVGRLFHPLRWQRWALSDVNPFQWWLPAIASIVKANRWAAPPENPYRRIEKAASDATIATLDFYRDFRDATLEALFFQIFGPPAMLGVVGEPAGEAKPAVFNPRELPLVRDALATIGKGGYAEAIALIGALVGKGAGRITPARLELVDRFIRSDKVLSRLSADEVRRVKSEQAVIAELEPERGLESLPTLLADPADRRRALAVLDEAVAAVKFTAEQHDMLDRVRAILGGKVRRLEHEWPDMAERELAEST